MEQLIKPVESDTQSPIGEWTLTPTIAPALPQTFTKVDNNLTGIGYFSASSKRSRKAIEKTTVIADQGVVRSISIIPSAKYGLPITQDQDFWLALMQLVEERRRLQGNVITNPFTFTTAELIKILGQAHSGKNYKAVQEWLSVMKNTGIEGGAYNVAKKKWLKDRVSAVDRALSIGEDLPNGTSADKNYIWFAEWQLDNINAGKLLALEMATYTQLENNIAKNLVPHLQEWLYASQRDGRFEKQYAEVCHLLGIRVYRYRSEIERKFGPSLNELVIHGYIARWAIEPMADRKTYKLVLWHGPKYHSDRQTRIEQKARIKGILPAGEQQPSQASKPRQKPLRLEPEIDADLLTQLLDHGVTEAVARRTLTALPADYPIRDVLEWLTFELSKPHNIKSPAAFIISHLQRQDPPPATFVSSAARKAQDEAILRQQQARQQETEHRQAEEEARHQTINAQLDRIKEQDPARWQALYDQAKALVFALPVMKGKRYSPIHDGAIRSAMRSLLQPTPGQAELPIATEPQPAEPAAALTNQPPQQEPQYATNPPAGQAGRLPESISLQPRPFDLQALLTTLQLPSPDPTAE
jgi:hypothetical protein